MQKRGGYAYRLLTLIAPFIDEARQEKLLPLSPRKQGLQMGEEVLEDSPRLFWAPSLFSVTAFVGDCRDNIKKRLLSVARTNAHERCRDRKTMQIVVVAL